MKSNEHKYKPHYVYSSLIKAIARVREYGIEKHRVPGVNGEETWKDESTMDLLDATRRHIDEVIEAVRNKDITREFDSESHQHHLNHAVTNVMFLIERIDEKGAL